MDWITNLSPAVILGLVFYFVIANLRGRIRNLEENKTNEEVFQLVQKELKDSIDEVKTQNGKLDTKVDKQGRKIAEIGTDIRWIRKAIEKNNG